MLTRASASVARRAVTFRVYARCIHGSASTEDEYADIRDGVAKLCSKFGGEYWRELDRERGCELLVVNDF